MVTDYAMTGRFRGASGRFGHAKPCGNEPAREDAMSVIISVRWTTAFASRLAPTTGSRSGRAT